MSAMDSAQTLKAKPDTSTQARIPSPWVWILRVIWVLLLLPLLIILVASFGAYYEQLVRLELVGFYQEGWASETLRAAITATGLEPSFIASLVTAQQIVSAVVFCTVGLLIFWRRSDEWIGLMTSFALVGLGLANGPGDPSSVPEILALPILVVSTMVWPTLFILPTIFPDGRFVPAWMRYFPPAIYGLFVVGLIFFDMTQTPPTPIVLLVFGMVILSIGAGVYRYLRRSSALEKQQTKWFLFGMAMWLVINLIMVVIYAIFQFSGPSLLIFRLVQHMLSVSFTLIPLGLAFGLLRYRLWDVDFVINRALVYGAMTVLLLALAGGGLFVISQLAINLPGGPLIGVAIGATVFGATFNPVQKALRKFVDQRFYGVKLDYVEAVKAYGGTRREARKTGGTKSTFGTYTGLTLLGRGGMGEVYRAQHPTLNRSVAIKILPNHSSTNDEAYKRFMREAQTVATLKHANVITLFDVGEQDGKPYMVMEYIDGQDLSDLIRSRGRLLLAEALPILSDVAAALDHAHASGVIHRDVKPSNVMIEKVTETGKGKTTRAVLMDFGIAKGYNAGTRLTQSGMIGTLDYISPEQIQGAAEVDARADVYSFGVMAYETLTGELPFKHNNPGAMVLAHLNQPAPDPREIVRDLTESVALAVMRAMNKRSEQRFTSAGEMVTAMAS